MDVLFYFILRPNLKGLSHGSNMVGAGARFKPVFGGFKRRLKFVKFGPCTPLHYPVLLYTIPYTMYSFTLLCTPLHYYVLLYTIMYSFIHYYVLLSTIMYSFTLLCTPLHYYVLLYTIMYSFIHY